MISLNLQTPNKSEQRSNPVAPLSVGWHHLFDHGSTFADIDVNPRTAMQSETVNGCVSLISSSIASLPLILYERNSNGSGKTEAFGNFIHSLLKHECSPESTPETLFTEVVKDILLYGQSFLEITRAGSKITGLWFLHSPNVRAYRNPQGDLLYDVTIGTNRRTLPATSICHFVGNPSGDGVTGVSVIHTAKETIAENLAIQKHGNLYFSNGVAPSGILSSEKQIRPEDVPKMRREWEEQHLRNNKHRVAILSNSMSYTPINFTTAVDTDLVKAKEWSRSAVAGLFHVNTQLLSSEARVSGEVYSSQMLAYYELALKPIMKKIQSELLRKLFPGQLSRFVIEYRWMDLLKSDPSSMMEALSVVRNSAIYSTDELREMQGLNPVGGEVGSTILCPVNLTASQNVIDKAPDPKIAPMGSGSDNE
jgi:HK97 family phage portal protein